MADLETLLPTTAVTDEKSERAALQELVTLCHDEVLPYLRRVVAASAPSPLGTTPSSGSSSSLRPATTKHHSNRSSPLPSIRSPLPRRHSTPRPLPTPQPAEPPSEPRASTSKRRSRRIMSFRSSGKKNDADAEMELRSLERSLECTVRSLESTLRLISIKPASVSFSEKLHRAMQDYREEAELMLRVPDRLKCRAAEPNKTPLFAFLSVLLMPEGESMRIRNQHELSQHLAPLIFPLLKIFRSSDPRHLRLLELATFGMLDFIRSHQSFIIPTLLCLKGNFPLPVGVTDPGLYVRSPSKLLRVATLDKHALSEVAFFRFISQASSKLTNSIVHLPSLNDVSTSEGRIYILFDIASCKLSDPAISLCKRIESVKRLDQVFHYFYQVALVMEVLHFFHLSPGDWSLEDFIVSPSISDDGDEIVHLVRVNVASTVEKRSYQPHGDVKRLVCLLVECVADLPRCGTIDTALKALLELKDAEHSVSIGEVALLLKALMELAKSGRGSGFVALAAPTVSVFDQLLLNRLQLRDKLQGWEIRALLACALRTLWRAHTAGLKLAEERQKLDALQREKKHEAGLNNTPWNEEAARDQMASELAPYIEAANVKQNDVGWRALQSVLHFTFMVNKGERSLQLFLQADGLIALHFAAKVAATVDEPRLPLVEDLLSVLPALGERTYEKGNAVPIKGDGGRTASTGVFSPSKQAIFLKGTLLSYEVLRSALFQRSLAGLHTPKLAAVKLEREDSLRSSYCHYRLEVYSKRYYPLKSYLIKKMDLVPFNGSDHTQEYLSKLGKLLVQILDAICFCHSFGLVHADLKLENILLNLDKNGSIHNAVLGDLDTMRPATDYLKFLSGMSTYVDSTNAPIDEIFQGPRAYHDPKASSVEGLRLKRRVTSTRQDVWAFGLIVAQLLTGALDPSRIDETDCNAARSFATELRERCCGHPWHYIVQRCLAYERPELTPTAEELRVLFRQAIKS